MQPISRLQILNHSPRTLQRWEWERIENSVVLMGMIIFLGPVPGRGLGLDVTLMDGRGVFLGSSAARVDAVSEDRWPFSAFRGEFETEVEPPYRLRVRFVRDGLPPSRAEMIKVAEAQIRPWKRRELPSSS